MTHPIETEGIHPEVDITLVGIKDRAKKPQTTINYLKRIASRECFPHSISAIPELKYSIDYHRWNLITLRVQR